MLEKKAARNFSAWLPRFYTKAIMQRSRKYIKNQNKTNSYKFLKPSWVPREDVGGHKGGVKKRQREAVRGRE